MIFFQLSVVQAKFQISLHQIKHVKILKCSNVHQTAITSPCLLIRAYWVFSLQYFIFFSPELNMFGWTVLWRQKLIQYNRRIFIVMCYIYTCANLRIKDELLLHVLFILELFNLFFLMVNLKQKRIFCIKLWLIVMIGMK